MCPYKKEEYVLADRRSVLAGRKKYPGRKE
jgi:hypothetical protein